MNNKKNSIKISVLSGLLFLIFIVFFSVLHSRNALMNSIKLNFQAKTREKLLVGKTFLSKTFDPEIQLSIYLRTKIRQIIDETPQMDIREALPDEFNELFSNKIPGLSWHYYEYITPADYTNSTASLNSIILKSSGGNKSPISNTSVKNIFSQAIKYLAHRYYEKKQQKLIDKDIRKVFGDEIINTFGNKIRESSGNLISVNLNRKPYLMMWQPVYLGNWLDSSSRFVKDFKSDVEERNRNIFNLIGGIVIFIDESKFSKFNFSKLVALAKFNLNKMGIIAKEVSDKSVLSEQNLDNSVETSIKLTQPKQIIFNLSTNLKNDKTTEIDYNSLCFLIMGFWLTVCLWLVGNFLIMGKSISAGLKIQTTVVLVIVLIPAMLIGLLTMERYLEERKTSFIRQLSFKSIENLKAFDKGLGIYKTWVFTELNNALIKIGNIKKLDTLINKHNEFAKLIHNKIFELGINIKNIFLLDTAGNIISLVAASSQKETELLKKTCTAFFQDTLLRLNPNTNNKNNKASMNLLLSAQAEEVLQILKTFLPPGFFPDMTNRLQSLDFIKGWGQEAYLFHKYFGRKQKHNILFQGNIGFPTLAKQHFNNWVQHFNDRSLDKTIWIVSFKASPDWFLQKPFWHSVKGKLFGTFYPLYDLLPYTVSTNALLASYIKAPLVREFTWHNKRWLFATYGGTELFKNQLYCLVPLESHYTTFRNFKLKVRLIMTLLVLIATLIGSSLAIRFLAPLYEISKASNSIMQGNLSTRLTIGMNDDELIELANEFNLVASDVESGNFLKKFVSNGAVEIASQGEMGIESDVESIEVIVMFIRLTNFENVLTSHEPAYALKELNSFFEYICEIVSLNGGEINKFIGEKAMAVFKISSDNNETVAKNALNAAVSIQNKGTGDLKALSCSIQTGISAGTVKSGLIGSQNSRIEQTVLGDTVNLSARLSTLPDADGILLNETFVKWLGETKIKNHPIKKLGDFNIKGKAKPVPVYKVC